MLKKKLFFFWRALAGESLVFFHSSGSHTSSIFFLLLAPYSCNLQPSFVFRLRKAFLSFIFHDTWTYPQWDYRIGLLSATISNRSTCWHSILHQRGCTPEISLQCCTQTFGGSLKTYLRTSRQFDTLTRILLFIHFRFDFRRTAFGNEAETIDMLQSSKFSTWCLNVVLLKIKQDFCVKVLVLML